MCLLVDRIDDKIGDGFGDFDDKRMILLGFKAQKAIFRQGLSESFALAL